MDQKHLAHLDKFEDDKMLRYFFILFLLIDA